MAKLYFYFAAMNAGKTTTLLQSNYNYHERGMQTMLFLPIFDVRKGEGIIASRIGLEANAITFNSDFNFYQYVAEHKPHMPNLKCIMVDEAHFMNKEQVQQLAMIVDHFHLPVLAYGLRTDFQSEPFEGSKYLLSWAEELIEIKTICDCGSKATMNIRVDANGRAVTEGEQVEIGGNDRYISVCRKHYYERIAAD